MTEQLTSSGLLLKNVMDALFALPKTKVNRDAFLSATFISPKYSEDIKEKILRFGPVSAGVSRGDIAKMAKGIVNHHKLLCSGASFGLGIPGGWSMAATIPADLAQFYTHLIICAQKLSYLYGFEDLNSMPDSTRYQILLAMLAIMIGAKTGDFAKIVASNYAKRFGKKIIMQGGTKMPLYKLINYCAKVLGFDKLTKKGAAQVLGKAAPIVGGFVSGGITWFSFQSAGKRLIKYFEELAFNQE